MLSTPFFAYCKAPWIQIIEFVGDCGEDDPEVLPALIMLNYWDLTCMTLHDISTRSDQNYGLWLADWLTLSVSSATFQLVQIKIEKLKKILFISRRFGPTKRLKSNKSLNYSACSEAANQRPIYLIMDKGRGNLIRLVQTFGPLLKSGLELPAPPPLF